MAEQKAQQTAATAAAAAAGGAKKPKKARKNVLDAIAHVHACLLYTSDAADE